MELLLKIARCYIIIFFVMISNAVHADDHRDLILSFNLYPIQTRVSDDADFTLNSGARLTDRISYYGFVNFRNTLKSDDITMVVSEQKLRWNLTEKLPVDIEGEYKIRAGEDNDEFQTGVRLRVDDAKFLKPFFR